MASEGELAAAGYQKGKLRPRAAQQHNIQKMLSMVLPLPYPRLRKSFRGPASWTSAPFAKVNAPPLQLIDLNWLQAPPNSSLTQLLYLGPALLP